jgi:hypothetical protein
MVLNKDNVYVQWDEVDVRELQFAISQTTKGVTVSAVYGAACKNVCFITPAAITNYPRCSDGGNLGGPFAPEDPQKAKYTLDLTDDSIRGEPNEGFAKFKEFMEKVDDKLLEFVHSNQMRLLGRKNLSIDEVKMLQIRSVKPKYDKLTGALLGHNFNVSSQVWRYDGMGSKYERKVTVCDADGTVIQGGAVRPGDCVSVEAGVGTVYTGVGGDKFGIQWSFDAVSVVCQRCLLDECRTEVPSFFACATTLHSPMFLMHQ